MPPDTISMMPNRRRKSICGKTEASATPRKLPPMPASSKKGSDCHSNGVRNTWMTSAAPEEKIKKIRLMPCAVICGRCSTAVSHVTSSPALPTPSPERTATKKVIITVSHISHHQNNARDQHCRGEDPTKNARGDPSQGKGAERTPQHSRQDQPP